MKTGSVLETLLENRKSAVEEIEARRVTLMEELETLVHDEDGKPRKLEPEQEERCTAILSEVDQIDTEIADKTAPIEKRLAEEAKRIKKDKKITEARKDISVGNQAAVTYEPMIYGMDKDGVGSPNSWYGDMARRALSGMTGNDGGATQRLAEYAHQVEREIVLDSQIGRKAEGELRELNREFGAIEGPKRMAELRERGKVALDQKTAELEMRNVNSGPGGATATAGSGGGAFVTPIFTEPDYVPYRELGRAFADACTKKPLPAYGMTVYIPNVTAAIEVSTQVEEAGVKESGTGFGYLSGSLTTIAGEQFITQQLLDRAGPNFAFDVMLFDQLERDYAPKFDVAVLEAALTSATEQSWTGNGGTFELFAKGKSGGFAGQVAKAKGDMRKLAGTILNPTHLFLQQSRWEYLSAFTDENGRPLVNPQYAGPFAAVAGGSSDGDEGIEGDTGYRLAGLPVFQDGSIPKKGTLTGTAEQDQAIVGCLREVWVYEGPAVTRMLPQTKATELLVLAQRYSYYTVIKRYTKAITVITGTAMKQPVYSN